jgi:hypothetical protein
MSPLMGEFSGLRCLYESRSRSLLEGSQVKLELLIYAVAGPARSIDLVPRIGTERSAGGTVSAPWNRQSRRLSAFLLN